MYYSTDFLFAVYISVDMSAAYLSDNFLTVFSTSTGLFADLLGAAAGTRKRKRMCRQPMLGTKKRCDSLYSVFLVVVEVSMTISDVILGSMAHTEKNRALLK